MQIASRIFRADVQQIARVVNPQQHYEHLEDAQAAARAQSRTAPCGLFVEYSSRHGYYVTPLGTPGAYCYFMGKHETEWED